MNKQLICAVLASLAVFSVSGAPDEGKMDLGKVNPENGQPQGWVLNAVKLSKTPDPVPPVAAVKKLSRAALRTVAQEDVCKFLQTLVDIRDAEERIVSVPLAKNFTDRSGGILYKKRTEFLSDLYALHE